MKIVGLIPSLLSTDKIPYKNIKKLGGIPLINYTVRILNKVKQIEDIYVFSSESEICNHILDSLEYQFLQRSSDLDKTTTTIQDIIQEFLSKIKADIIVLLHITSPFMNSETISDCIEQVKNGKFDSAFSAYEIKKFCWFKGKPLNYSITQPTPRSQDLDPVIAEQSSLYVFRKEEFEKTGQRISKNHYIKIIDHFEGHDIETPEDFKVAELIVNTGMFGIK